MPSVKDIENWARSRGIPVEQAFQELGMKVERTIQPAADALKQMSDNISNSMTSTQRIPVPSSPPNADRNDATLSNQAAYEDNLRARLQQNADAGAAQQQNSDNFNPDDYTKYAMGGEVAPHDEHLGKPKFNHLKDLMKKHRKANSEIEASNNPQKFMDKMKNPSIKGKKGIAF